MYMISEQSALRTIASLAHETQTHRHRGFFMSIEELIEELREALKTHDVTMVHEHVKTVLDTLVTWEDLRDDLEITDDMIEQRRI